MNFVMAVYLLCLDQSKNFIFWSNAYISTLCFAFQIGVLWRFSDKQAVG